MTQGLAAPSTGGGSPAEPQDRRPSQVLAWVFGLAFGCLVLYVTFALYDRFGPADAAPRLLSYEVISDTQVQVDFTVTKDPEAQAVCLVRSRNKAGAEVGHADVRVPANGGGDGTVRLRQVVTTSERAVTGEVPRCVVLEPGEPLPTHDEDAPTPAG